MTSAVHCPHSQHSCTHGCDKPCKPVEAEVFPLSQKRHDLQKLVEHIKIVVYQYTGRISVTEAIGALEIAKIEIYEGQK